MKLRTAIKHGVLLASLSIFFFNFFPLTFSMFPMTSCAPESVTQKLCENQNVWLGSVFSFSFLLGGAIIPFIFGFLISEFHFRNRIATAARMQHLAVSIISFILVTNIFEVLWLEPWRTLVTPSGVTYTSYSLDAIFGTFFMVFFVLIILLGYSIKIISYFTARQLSLQSKKP